MQISKLSLDLNFEQDSWEIFKVFGVSGHSGAHCILNWQFSILENKLGDIGSSSKFLLETCRIVTIHSILVEIA